MHGGADGSGAPVRASPDFGAVLNDFRFWQMEMVENDDRTCRNSSRMAVSPIEAIWLRANVSAPPGFLAEFS
jgi:hypothetical protein